MSEPTNRPVKQVHLAAHFPGVNNTTVWSDPAAGSHIDFASFRRFAQTAERGRFDFLFLAEGLRLREQNGQIYDLDVVGRPDTFTVLSALAAVTDKLGLAGTINSTFNEPYEVARQFASLDHLSAGHRAYLTGRGFFPALISGPFADGLSVAFDFATAACVVAAFASLLRGGRYDVVLLTGPANQRQTITTYFGQSAETFRAGG